MSKALVDTTLLVDVLLKPGPLSQRAKMAIDSYTETELPVYAIKEFRAGALNHYVWLYNKLVITDSYPDTLQAISSIYRMRNKQATALGALQVASYSIQNKKVSVVDSKDVNPMRVVTDETRLMLRAIITKAWKKRRKITNNVVHELECFDERDPEIKNNKLYELTPLGCMKGQHCCVAKYLHAKQDVLEAFREKLPIQDTKLETKNRRSVIKKLQKLKSSQLDRITEKDCRHIGDAAFAVYCRSDQVVLTTNVTDHELLADALGKKVESIDSTLNPS